MTQPTSQGFGALPVRSCASVVVLNEIVWSVQVRRLVISALWVSPGEVGTVLESVTAFGPYAASPHQVRHWSAVVVGGRALSAPAAVARPAARRSAAARVVARRN